MKNVINGFLGSNKQAEIEIVCFEGSRKSFQAAKGWREQENERLFFKLKKSL